MKFLGDKSFGVPSGCKQTQLNGVELVPLQRLVCDAIGGKDVVVRKEDVLHLVEVLKIQMAARHLFGNVKLEGGFRWVRDRFHACGE